ncbi:MAG TPA: flagellar biosynthesis anti-sigma factor FlgM [Candidatus Hydrogenedentes bacterium]|mgnify:CR=1 FL=1|nr:flagellar biosynthesis anti-sigma factor FlgM [Candidatus Hydrogenedentota bacterium]HOS03941.1 flagellar biosynthesis anti-sigma factor FlgM [Candidatus Hydrogenedentota bacterium]
MTGIKGIGGVPEPAPDRSASIRDRKRDEAKISVPKDGVAISAKAQEAANVARLTQMAKQDGGVRAERVAAAKQNLQDETYKLPEILTEVAKQLSRYLP